MSFAEWLMVFGGGFACGWSFRGIVMRVRGEI